MEKDISAKDVDGQVQVNGQKVSAETMQRIATKQKDGAGQEGKESKPRDLAKPFSELFYEDLTPHADINNHSDYIDAIKWAVDNENVNNLALTGPYGSGKSSILKSFKAKYGKTYPCLDVSLATFDEEEKSNLKERQKEIQGNSHVVTPQYPEEEDSDTSDSDPSKPQISAQRKELRLIELSILQQLFYQAKHDDIPNSRFLRIRDFQTRKYFWFSMGIVFWLVNIFFLVPPKFLSNQTWWSAIVSKLFEHYYIIAILVVVAGLIAICFYSFKAFRNYKFNKLNITSGEIQIDQKNDRSVLNKYLDEIIYFFQKTSYKAVVFEDLDRFNNEEIFTKLRELNYLINRSAQVDKRIVFIYALKDDMFIDKTRTKFFDFIIPIIPVIHSSNSFEELYKKLNNQEAGIELSKKFVRDISFFVDDMRMLKNIYNEFLIYKAKLAIIDIDHDKLFAFILYKNTHPSDFAELNYNSGMVYRTFQNKGKVISAIEEDMKKEISKLRAKIKLIEDSLISSIGELRAVYLFKTIEKLNSRATYITLNGQPYKFNKLNGNEPFGLLSICENIRWGAPNVAVSSSGISFQQIESEVNPNETYADREKKIQDLNKYSIQTINNEIDELAGNLKAVRNWPLTKVCRETKEQVVFDLELKDNDLLLYLLKNGYIDENYGDYISYFYEGSITKGDKDFILSIINQKPKEFSYPLTKITNLLDQLSDEELSRDEALNIQLVDFLFTNQSAYKIKFNNIVTIIVSGDKRSVEFVDEYIDNGKCVGELIKIVCNRWDDFWRFLLFESNYGAKNINRYLKLMLLHGDVSDLKRLDAENGFTEHIKKQSDFLSLIKKEDNNVVERKLLELGVKFKVLENVEMNSSLFDFIYENDLYELNEKMIELILTTKDKGLVDNLEKLQTKNYTIIRNSACEHLKEYIDSEIDDYSENVILNDPLNVDESEESLILLLNHKTLSPNNKEKILLQQNVKINEIGRVKSAEIWPILILNSKVTPVWNNVYLYYIEANGVDDNLCAYLNDEDNYIPLSEDDISVVIPNFSEDHGKQFQDSILFKPEISDVAFRYLLKQLTGLYLGGVSWASLNESKVSDLLSAGSLWITTANYSELKEHFPDKQIDLIIQRFDRFFESHDDYSLETYEKELLLNSDLIAVQKLQVLSIIENDEIDDETDIATAMSTVLVDNPDSTVDFDTLYPVMQFGKIEENNLILFDRYLLGLTHNEIAKLLISLGKPYSKIDKRGGQVSLPKSEIALSIANKLEATNFTGKVREKERKITIYLLNRK